MEEKIGRPISLHLHLAALFLTIIVFVAGVWFGSSFSKQVGDDFALEIDALQTSSSTLELLDFLSSSEAIQTDPTTRAAVCNELVDKSWLLASQTEQIADKLAVFEKRREDSFEAKLLANKYFELEVRDYIFWQRVNQLCGYNNTVVLYFYDKNCNDCAEVETSLSNFKRTASTKVLVYSLPLERRNSNPSIAALASLYHVENAPSLIVNGKKLTAVSIQALQVAAANIG